MKGNIAALVPVGIVDPLEMVNIEKDNRCGSPRPPATRLLLPGHFQKSPAIRYFGEEVFPCQSFQPLCLFLQHALLVTYGEVSLYANQHFFRLEWF